MEQVDDKRLRLPTSPLHSNDAFSIRLLHRVVRATPHRRYPRRRRERQLRRRLLPDHDVCRRSGRRFDRRRARSPQTLLDLLWKVATAMQE